MIITKKRIKNVDFIKKIKNLNTIKIGVLADNETIVKLDLELEKGANSILPSAKFGPNCRRNANGYWKIYKDKPKESKIVNTIEWHWKQWAGRGIIEEHSKYVDITREVYPREFVEPEAIEIILVKQNHTEFLIADLAITNFEEQALIIKQTINMFLEIFGHCQLFDESYNMLIDKSKIKRCNWEILPKGTKIWLTNNCKRVLDSDKNNRKDFNQHRIDFVQEYNPIDIYVGTNGFNGYYIFIFSNFCILENGNYGNATYIMKKDNWEILSQLSKGQLINGKLIIERVIHSSNWDYEMNVLVNNLKEEQ